MTDDGSTLSHKRAALNFLQLVIAGRIDEAYSTYVDRLGKHHNPFFPAGFDALKQGMLEDQVRFPNKQLVVRNVLGDGDLVAVHSHLMPAVGNPGLTVVHLFRFKGDKIVELWDCGQPVPLDSPNEDGAF